MAINGIENPILCFFGVSEPSSFYAALESSRELLTGGFLSRALIFTEASNVPEINPNPQPNLELPNALLARLLHIYNLGYHTNEEQISLRESVEHIRLNGEANAILATIRSYWHSRAKEEEVAGTMVERLCLRGQETAIKVAGILAAEKK